VALEVLWHLEHMRQLALRLVLAVGLACVLCSGFRNLRLMLGHMRSFIGPGGVDTAWDSGQRLPNIVEALADLTPEC